MKRTRMSGIVTTANPDPSTLPTLSVWQRGKETLVSSTFPNVPDLTCDSWCYESPVDFIGARSLDGGRIALRHRVLAHPNVVLVTTVTPEPGAVEFVAELRLAIVARECRNWFSVRFLKFHKHTARGGG